MNIAVIGGSGFIGKSLLENKLLINHKIIATYSKKKPKFNYQNVKWKKLNIFDFKKNSFDYLENPEIVIFCSWPGLPNYTSKIHETKILFFQKKIFLNLIKSGVKNITILGTCFEYGKVEGKLKENIKVKPANPYSRAKNKLRIYIQNLNKKYKFNYIWARLFYIYGKNFRRDTLFNLILKSQKKKKLLYINEIYKRDYLSLDNVSKLILLLAIQRKNFGIVNICSGKSIYLKTLVKKAKVKDNYIRFHSSFSNNYEPINFWGDNTKLNKILNYAQNRK